MANEITFSPSGKTCEIEENETVLQASLRAGMTPAYGCSNGNCGECKAVLKSGEVEQVRHFDYRFTPQEKQDGCFLMCTNRALTDLTIEADVTQGPESVPFQSIETKVKSITPLDPQVIQLHLQTPRSQRLRFIAGQSVTLTAGDGSSTILPIASCPCDDRNLLFHIPNNPVDPFCENMFSGALKTRQTVLLEGPVRDAFVLDDSDIRPSLILCWHTGFAPVISLIEHAMSLELEKEIRLIRFSPTPDNQYLSNLCRSWADAYDNISVDLMPQRISLLSPVDQCAGILQDIADACADLANTNVYVSAPPNFTEAAQQVFDDLNPDQLRTRTDWRDLF